MSEYCNYFNCFCDDEEIENKRKEMGEDCLIDCQECEQMEEL